MPQTILDQANTGFLAIATAFPAERGLTERTDTSSQLNTGLPNPGDSSLWDIDEPSPANLRQFRADNDLRLGGSVNLNVTASNKLGVRSEVR
jgi:hypothetical protein